MCDNPRTLYLIGIRIDQDIDRIADYVDADEDDNCHRHDNE